MGLIPNNIIVEILVRLPVKSLFRFKCVSKTWNNMISDDSFRHRYKSRRIAASGFFFHKKKDLNDYKPPPRMPYEGLVKFINTSKVENEELKSLDLDFLNKLGYVIASSKGLILVTRNQKRYHVCDLVTKTYITLPKVLIKSYSCVGVGFICQEYQHTDSSLRFRFKVVRIKTTPFFSSSKTCVIETYSSETGKWKKSIVTAASEFTQFGHEVAHVIGGVFCWVENNRTRLVAFNPEDEQGRVKLIELPVREYETYLCHSFSKTQEGELQCVRMGSHIEVWILRSNKWEDTCSFDDVIRWSGWSLVEKTRFDTPRVSIASCFAPLGLEINPLNLDESFIWRVDGILLYDRVDEEFKKVGDYKTNIWFKNYIITYYEFPIWPCLSLRQHPKCQVFSPRRRLQALLHSVFPKFI